MLAAFGRRVMCILDKWTIQDKNVLSLRLARSIRQTNFIILVWIPLSRSIGNQRAGLQLLSSTDKKLDQTD